MAQAGVDVAHLSELGMRGTARFMSMGGAFTALGGDLSTLGQNPAGIGIYRSSEVGITLDLNFQSFQASAPSMTDTHNQTRFNVNNFGYIGTMKLYSEATPTFSFGASYSRINSFDRVFRATSITLAGLRSPTMWLHLPTRSILWATGIVLIEMSTLSGAVITIRMITLHGCQYWHITVL